MTKLGQRAVVLGGSMAGMLAARVLAEEYAEVTVVDRDRILGVRTARRGAPHTVHAHGLHARGQLILEELFGGLTDELRAAGVPTGDLGEMRWFFDARKLAPAHTGLLSVTAPRPVLEHHVRSRVAALPNVTILEECSILDLVTTDEREQVVGVRILRGSGAAEPEVLDADLVVDATGRGSRTPAWLEQLGYRRPDEHRVKVRLAYTTRHYRTEPGMFDGVQSINPVASPAHPRGAFFGQVGRDKCILSLTGVLGDYPPTDPDGFMSFVRSLPVPDVYEAVKDAEALDDPVSFRFAASVRRRYEKLFRFPDRLLVIGDALCSFNPVYGQGMSVAAVQAITLRDHLRRSATPEPLSFFTDISRVIDNPWDIAAGGDLAFPGVEGNRTLKVRLGNAYMARLQYAASKDATVTDGFMRVAGLMDPPESLMSPAMVLRVLSQSVDMPQSSPVPAALSAAVARTAPAAAKAAAAAKIATAVAVKAGTAVAAKAGTAVRAVTTTGSRRTG